MADIPEADVHFHIRSDDGPVHHERPKRLRPDPGRARGRFPVRSVEPMMIRIRKWPHMYSYSLQGRRGRMPRHARRQHGRPSFPERYNGHREQLPSESHPITMTGRRIFSEFWRTSAGDHGTRGLNMQAAGEEFISASQRIRRLGNAEASSYPDRGWTRPQILLRSSVLGSEAISLLQALLFIMGRTACQSSNPYL